MELVGDPGRLRQVVINLVGNAIKFTPQGEVIVSVSVQTQRASTVCLHFIVLDTGIGVSFDKQKLIFQAFEQADPSITRIYGGTGLGLAIVSKLVAMMRGEMWLKSRPEDGSAFHFTAWFDLVSPSSPAVVVAPESWQGSRVLVVDDNSTNRRILEDILKNWGLEPVLVDSGLAALETLDRALDDGQTFPLILLDACMPSMDGFTVAERIKTSRHANAGIVLMLSSSGQPADLDRCRQLGVTAYLTKPIKQSELFDCLCQLIDKPCAETPLAISTALVDSPDSPPDAPSSRPLTILVAEDNVVNQRVAKGILDKRGHTVIIANNGREALQALATQRFDLSHGPPDAGNGRARSHCRNSPDGNRDGRPHADRRHDRACPDGRSRALPCRRNGRLSVEADSARAVARHDRIASSSASILKMVRRRPDRAGPWLSRITRSLHPLSRRQRRQ